ncbi:DUF4185 domain-containing protein [Streptomyces anatolicus]|uniref:DUF4185 domain-containing protein n=1 Tax=Streptomyces anatolicus TaxID=2675858 RepID=UPI001CA58F62|nr:DUF4185 domain-containing protein [Streptomyces anatolicus]
MSDQERHHGVGGRIWLVLLLALALAAVLLVVLPRDDRGGDGDGASTACRPRTVASWSAEEKVTEAFTRYGDDGTRTDDWTGGDGTHSVRLPDGRVLWLFSDTLLGRVHAPPNTAGQPHSWRDPNAPMVRNSAVVMSRSGTLERTLPAPLFTDPAPQQWRWPVAARVEPRSLASDEKVVRVLLWNRMASQGPWIYGVPMATEVATLSLPDLRVEGVVKVSDQQRVADPEKRVLYGTATVDDDGWTYVFGGTDAQATSRPSSDAHVARVRHGRLAEAAAWEYWDGEEWGKGPSRPVLGDGRRKGVGSAFTVVRDEGTYVLFTMAAGAKGLTEVTSYWSCSPTGPWHGPAKGFEAPLPKDSAARQDTAAYNPQAHPALGRDGRVVLSYDVNWLDPVPASAQANINRNVALYRPRFVSLRLAEPR